MTDIANLYFSSRDTNAGVEKYLGVNGKLGNASRDNPPAKLSAHESAAETIERCRLETERLSAIALADRKRKLPPI